MSVKMAAQALADAANATASHADTTPYVLAFLSSTAVEVIAVATILTMLAFAVTRSLFRSNAFSDRSLRLHRAIDVLKLSKMLIPLACLSATVWVWSLVQGA